MWALVSGFNCPLCQIGDNKQFEALSGHRSSLLSPLLARGEATDRTLKQDVSVREVNLCCDGVADITASFIVTDCSDTSKSGPINLQAGGGVTGACEGAAALHTATNVCLTSFTGALAVLALGTLLACQGDARGVVLLIGEFILYLMCQGPVIVLNMFILVPI